MADNNNQHHAPGHEPGEQPVDQALAWPWDEPSSLRFAAIRCKLSELEIRMERRISEWLTLALDHHCR